MSTIATLKMALTGARSAYDAYAGYRDRKMDKAYETLSSAAEAYGPKADEAMETARHKYDDSVKKAGNVTKAARVRLEKALATVEDRGEDVKKGMNRMERRKAEKLGKKALKASAKKDSHWMRNLAVVALTASGVAAVAYAVMNKRKQTPGTTTPRVEDQRTPVEEAPVQETPIEEEPVLVYSTETGDDERAEGTADQAAEDTATELEVDAAVDSLADTEDAVAPAAEVTAGEDDEDVDALLEDLADAEAIQVEADAVQAEFDAKNAPQRDQSAKDK